MNITFGKIMYTIITIVSIGLAIGGFFVPPTGVIDGSVITTIGILTFAGMFAKIPDIIKSASTVRLHHGKTSVTVKRRQKTKETKN